jgi:uncharacterized protein (TIGR03435 family)
MTITNLSAWWNLVAPGVGNHLWQSTLFAAGAGLLTLIVQKQHARVRYALWLAASLKFLVPFSLLVGLGSHLAWSRAVVSETPVYVAIEQISQPFQQAAAPVISAAAPAMAVQSLLHLLPAFLLAGWFCGVAAVLIRWYVRWRRVAADLRESTPLRAGRELEALRRQERIAGLRAPIDLVSSPSSLEPGIFGIARPVLLWPKGISEHLEPAHVEAIIAHELRHVRRRDNLAAAIHMVVEALFWFHPLVWWLGTRLVEERERACDEEVVELGSERQVYAESILKVCEFCVGSPLACVSGVTGSDLKKRMVYIMTERMARKLDFGRKLLLTAAALLAFALPVGLGIATATQGHAQAQADDSAAITPDFEASIKPSEISTPTYAGSGAHMVRMMFSPSGFQAANASLKSIIQEAYGVQANQIAGPKEIDTIAYDIELKTDQPAASELTMEQRMQRNRSMLQALLANRFQLKVHRQSTELPIYILTVAENGSKLQPSRSEGFTVDFKGPDGKAMAQHRMLMQQDGGQVVGITAQGVPAHEIAQQLSRQLGINVVDKTGLTGNYDFNLSWTKDAASKSSNSSTDSASAASLFSAIHDQLGLNLDASKAPMEVLVIDHVEWQK